MSKAPKLSDFIVIDVPSSRLMPDADVVATAQLSIGRAWLLIVNGTAYAAYSKNVAMQTAEQKHGGSLAWYRVAGTSNEFVGYDLL